MRLYPGVDNVGEFCALGAGNGREVLVRLNNIVSFTGDRTHAGQFGAPILEIEVPVVKLLFFNDPLPRHPCAEKPSIWKAYGIRNPVHLDRGWPMIRKTSQRRERFRP
jgi:hypothetical protein